MNFDIWMLQAIGSIPAMTSLNLRSCFLFDGVQELARLTALRNLDLRFCGGVTDEGLRTLSGSLHRMASLDLGSCSRITREGIRSLCGFSSLCSLSLGACKGVDDDAIRAISVGLPTLRSLNLDCCLGISSEGMISLGGFKSLTELSLQRTAVDDEAMRILGSLSAMKHLDLCSTSKITDVGLYALGSLSGLAFLDLRESERITKEGVRALSDVPAFHNVIIRSLDLQTLG